MVPNTVTNADRLPTDTETPRWDNTTNYSNGLRLEHDREDPILNTGLDLKFRSWRYR